MLISRRTFAGGALGFTLGGQLAAPGFAQNSDLAAALAAIRRFGEVHLDHYGVPGLTLGVTMPNGIATVFNFGFSDRQARTPIGPDTLFQIGSISKLINAAILHQLAAEGQVRLSDRVSDLLPAVPLPAGNTIQVQHLLDHVSGLPSDAPLSSDGGLWTAYAPGEHWHYSNTGYEILGRLIEKVAGKSLAIVTRERILAPLGISRTRGAIISNDRALYAKGYTPADLPFAVGVPLVPAPWVDVTSAAVNLASTADDMNRLLRSLANAVQGRGGLGLSPEAGRAYATHSVLSDERGVRYGNGLMQYDWRGRSYLHHTGGMVSFTSSFHIDVASGVGAFASANIGALSDYRPRLLTQFAVDALTDAMAGHRISSPPRLSASLAYPASYIAKYTGSSGAFEVRAGNPLTIVADGQSATLQPWDGELFRTTHPSFRDFSLLFERKGSAILGAYWGPATYVRDGSAMPVPASDGELVNLAGHYGNDDPWFGSLRLVERGGFLWLGTETPIRKIADNLWRVGEQSWSPERGSFGDFVDGRPQTFVYSGEEFTRRDG